MLAWNQVNKTKKPILLTHFLFLKNSFACCCEEDTYKCRSCQNKGRDRLCNCYLVWAAIHRLRNPVDIVGTTQRVGVLHSDYTGNIVKLGYSQSAVKYTKLQTERKKG